LFFLLCFYISRISDGLETGNHFWHDLTFEKQPINVVLLPVSRERIGAHYELLGLVSWGQGCGRAGFPGVYTNISAIYDWLLDVLNQENQSAGASNDVRLDREIEKRNVLISFLRFVFPSWYL
jgi:Trypsin